VVQRAHTVIAHLRAKHDDVGPGFPGTLVVTIELAIRAFRLPRRSTWSCGTGLIFAD